MKTDPIRGLGRSPNEGLGEQSSPHCKTFWQFYLLLSVFKQDVIPRLNLPFVLLRSLHVYDTFIQILNVHTHQYLYYSL